MGPHTLSHSQHIPSISNLMELTWENKPIYNPWVAYSPNKHKLRSELCAGVRTGSPSHPGGFTGNALKKCQFRPQPDGQQYKGQSPYRLEGFMLHAWGQRGQWEGRLTRQEIENGVLSSLKSR